MLVFNAFSKLMLAITYNCMLLSNAKADSYLHPPQHKITVSNEMCGWARLFEKGELKINNIRSFSKNNNTKWGLGGGGMAGREREGVWAPKLKQ